MANYWSRNWGAKLATFRRTVERLENWPTALGMRLAQQNPRPRLLNFRDGLNVVCRGRTSDWDVVSELVVSGGYGLTLEHLRKLPGQPLVQDLGGNIGVFSLLAARLHPGAILHTYEPGPPNLRQCEINRLLNPSVAERIHLHREAVGGETRMTEFLYDDLNPQSSGMYARQGSKFPVQIRSFAEVVAACNGPVALAKIDIEGAEFDILERTPAAVWRNVHAVSIEVHDDPRGQLTVPDFLKKLGALGFPHLRQEPVASASYFLWRD